MDWVSGANVYWQHKLERLEVMKIILHEDAEFEAVNTTIEVNLNLHFLHDCKFCSFEQKLLGSPQGNHIFEVPAGHKMVVSQKDGG